MFIAFKAVRSLQQPYFCSFLVSISSIKSLNRTMSFQAKKDRFLSMSLEEKRKQYKCGSNFVTLDKIDRWAESGLGSKISIYRGDITCLEIDAIVNAANEQLAGGGGVDGFIHRAAGHKKLQAECETLGGCPTGDCKITGGYRLPAKYIIHCVGPVGEKAQLLASCYKRALDTLVENNLKSIAFPCISTGIYGYPNEEAAKVVLATVKQWLESNDDNNNNNIDRIIFALFLDTDIEIYNRLLPEYFPTA